ncbi:uncharacterized protein LOC123671045 [Harmonia axyridis]|uniref:uncharacterized protein LOC123671045 n=1 Tax=Harmonia axyridis TaxID=115357 RepID=UPI001E27853D|nr:uncharacterized protein LOC123671045 [Harmonia axyridis]
MSPTHSVTYTDKKNGIMLHELKKRRSDSDYSQSGLTSAKKEVYPLKIRSAEDCALANYSNLYKRASSRDSTDLESECEQYCNHRKGLSYKNEEKSQLICYKNNAKMVTIKNDTKLTKYNTFSMRCDKKDNRLTKYKSLDLPESRTVVRYVDPKSRVSLAASEFDTDFKMTKYRKKHDIIADTVDAWSKKNGKNVFANLKNSLFKSSSDKEIVYKPLIFGGTFPIDIPTKGVGKTDKGSFDRNNNSPLSQSPKVREYGPAKTFDIDQPI